MKLSYAMPGWTRPAEMSTTRTSVSALPSIVSTFTVRSPSRELPPEDGDGSARSRRRETPTPLTGSSSGERRLALRERRDLLMSTATSSFGTKALGAAGAGDAAWTSACSASARAADRTLFRRSVIAEVTAAGRLLKARRRVPTNSGRGANAVATKARHSAHRPWRGRRTTCAMPLADADLRPPSGGPGQTADDAVPQAAERRGRRGAACQGPKTDRVAVRGGPPAA